MPKLLDLLIAVAILAATAPAQSWVPLEGPWQLGRNAAYDRQRDRAVLFARDGETWELDGVQLLHRPWPDATAPRPTPRLDAAMAFDERRGHVLMFGGQTATSLLADTWVYDGNRWRQLAGPGPASRWRAAIAWDAARERVVMFGGIGSPTSALDDTWEHDGLLWLQRSPTNRPAVVPGSPRMTFDRARSVSVLIQGAIAGPGGQLATFLWDGVDWTQPTPTGSWPTARDSATVCYDESRQRVVMVGGQALAGQGTEIWEWDGVRWTLASATAWLDRQECATWYDPRSQRTVFVGGAPVFERVQRSDIWEWDGTTMTATADDLRPTQQQGAAWFPDPIAAREILFATGRTWAFDGLGWTDVQSVAEPGRRENACTAVDLAAGETLMFGGAFGFAMFDELWAFDGSTWILRDAGGGPGRRHGSVMAHDAARGRTVLFGGDNVGLFGGSAAALNDTWEWDGSVWRQRQPPGSPPARSRSAMAYDLARSRIVLHGGQTVTFLATDTWEWDGATWQQIFTPTSPPAMHGASMVFDPSRGRLVLVGTDLLAPQTTIERWEYDGITWQFLDRQDGTGRGPFGAVWNFVSQRLRIWDGTRAFEFSPIAADVTALGSGCGSPAPTLSATVRPRIGDAQFGLETLVAALSPALFATSFVAASTPIGGGCTIGIGPAVQVAFVAANARGFARSALPLPATTSLRGLRLFSQAAAIDPGSGALLLTQALQIEIGD